MKKKEIDYKKFIKYVHEKFKDKLTQEGVEKLLSLEEDYNKDSPASLGKSLSLNRLTFNGTKISGEVIDYDQKLNKGLNVWIADNGKGKSTIFKVIKYALTGNNTIKKDIKNWIKEIALEFQIGEVQYTIYINRQSRSSEGALYSFSLDSFLKLRKEEKLDISDKVQFSFKGDEALSNQIQTFFFNQFSYYALKYTQRSPNKEDLSLKTANLSWSTYFKTIYLESSDHNNLYFKEEKIGEQGRKIFEMILGLRLTYPINRLTFQLNKQLDEIGKIKLTETTVNKLHQENKVAVSNELIKINNELKELDQLNSLNFNPNSLIEEQIRLQDNINKTFNLRREVNAKYNSAVEERDKKRVEKEEYERDSGVVSNEITKLEKQLINFKLYQEAGSFFTNLEIESCPHCETLVSREKAVLEASTHTCMLCGSNASEQKVESDELKAKLEEITKQKSNYEKKRDELKQKIALLKNESKKLDDNVLQIYSELTKYSGSGSDQERLKQIDQELAGIRSQLNKLKELNTKKEELLAKKAILGYRLEEAAKSEPKNYEEELNLRKLNKDILSYALDALKQKRQALNKEILNKLEGLILREIQEFGLRNISKVQINESHDLFFTQNEEPMSFDDLNESERLRVKFAYYLSLIQLDIEYQLGRHPRFLIFDSPGSEEISKANLDGLSAIFQDVNKRFGTDLQIFLGTTLKEFSNVTDPEKSTIKKPEEVLF